MATIGGLQGPLMSLGRLRTFTHLVSHSPQAIPKVIVPFWQPKTVEDDVYIQFSEELEKSAEPFQICCCVEV